MFLNIDDLKKKYLLGKTEVHALRGITLKINKGDFCAIIGSSGSGKSTLLNIIGCMDTQDSGEVVIDDVSVRALNETQKSEFRNRKLGFIFQSFNLIPVLNVFENIELPLLVQTEINAQERKIRVQQAMHEVELDSFSKNLP